MPDIQSPQMIKEIVSENDSQTASKPDTPKLLRLNHSTRSLSTDVAVSNDPLKNMMRTSLRDTTPSRKYFDSGDYELAKAGIVSSSSVGSIQPNPEKLVSYSRSSSSHHLQQFIKSFGSRDDFGISADGSVKNQVAPNTNLRRSTVSIASLEEE